MTAAALADPRHWRAGDPALAAACRVVPEAALAELRAAAAAAPQLLAAPETAALTPLRRPALLQLASLVEADLRHGPGFCRLSLGGSALPAAEQRLLVLAVGHGLGQLLTQYGRLYAVKDRGADYRNSQAPVSMTSERTGFHTDSSARDVLPDYVALLCETPALRGGDSLVSNALLIRHELERQQPAALRLLEQDWIRDLVTPAADQSDARLRQNRFPVFARDGSDAGVTFRYMRYWLERGQQRAGAPVGAELLAALDRLDELLASPQYQHSFRLAAGDMLFVNNRTLAHDRTAFVDDPAAPRLLWRMWIARS